jgi:hypothetical protein
MEKKTEKEDFRARQGILKVRHGVKPRQEEEGR